PLSLNEPVGFAPSYLTCNSIPSISDMFSQYIKGVWPSFKLTLGVSAVTGKYSLNSSTSPCQFFINIKLLQLDKFSVQHNLILELDRKSTRLNSSHVSISYAVFCLQKI